MFYLEGSSLGHITLSRFQGCLMFFDRYLRTDGPDNYIDNETCRHGVFEKCSLPTMGYGVMKIIFQVLPFLLSKQYF